MPTLAYSDPPPYGTVTARWHGLSDQERDRHAHRLVGVDHRTAQLERPTLTDATADRYRRLIAHATAGDPTAVAWLAVIHRPLLVARGRVLRDRDPSEWGALALAALDRAIGRATPDDVLWMRRRVSQDLARQMRRNVNRTLRRRQIETPTDPAQLHRHQVAARGADHPLDLSVELDRVLARLDAPTRDAFLALADRRPLEEVAARHQMPHATVKQRVVRARPRLQSQLAAYHRTAR